MVSSSQNINKSGTGFGLYISNELSKYLCHQQGKGIQISSEFGKGSKFYFILENKKVYMSEVVKKIPYITPRNKLGIFKVKKKILRKRKTLIVDDDEFNYYSLKLLLKKYNFDCEYANNGRKAIEMI